MDIFGKKRIAELEGKVLELEAKIREFKEREVFLEDRYERRRKSLDEWEKALFRRGLAQVGRLALLQKKFHMIRNTATLVRAGDAPIERLLKEILHGKVR
jgi:hypothetical protein